MVCDERREADAPLSSIAVQIVIDLLKPNFKIMLRKTRCPKSFFQYSCVQLDVCSLNTL